MLGATYTTLAAAAEEAGGQVYTIIALVDPGLPVWKISTAIYRVAQNKIPHQTICSIFASSGQILKILEAV